MLEFSPSMGAAMKSWRSSYPEQLSLTNRKWNGAIKTFKLRVEKVRRFWRQGIFFFNL
jgi:hypothetical protein